MKRNTIIKASTRVLAVLFVSVVIGSCGHSTGEIAQIVSERDSLRNASKVQQRKIDNLNELVNIVNGSLDSIAFQESNLFNAGILESGDSKVATKEQVLENITRLEGLIESQKLKISSLEKRLSENDGEAPDVEMQTLVGSLKRQLARKDAEIANLKKELNEKNTDLSILREQNAKQSRLISELDKRASMQNEALKRQDAMLNQCYMVIASKKELESRGIIKKGRIIAQNALDRSKFSKVDIRKLTEISFTAKKPRILTSMPENSYELTTDGNHNFTLKITNPSSFWSVSNYLVIQTN